MSLSGATFNLSYGATLEARALAPSRGVGVRRRVVMSARASCHGQSGSAGVLLLSDCFQMCRIDARWVPTKMVDVQPVRDRPLHRLKCKAMSCDCFRCRIAKLTVARRIARTAPQPAIGSRTQRPIDLCPKPHVRRTIRTGQKLTGRLISHRDLLSRGARPSDASTSRGSCALQLYPPHHSDYDYVADLNANFHPYGGWTARQAKQFAGTSQIGRLGQIDLNILAP